MGYFDMLETPVEDIAVGFGIPNGEYEVTLTEISEIEKKENKGKAVVIKFTVDPGQPNAGKSHQQWVSVPDPSITQDREKLMNLASMMKQWLMNIGVPEGMVGEFDASNPEHADGVIGNTGTLKLRPQKNNPNYQNAAFYLDEVNKESGFEAQADKNAASLISNVEVPKSDEDMFGADGDFKF